MTSSIRVRTHRLRRFTSLLGIVVVVLLSTIHVQAQEAKPSTTSKPTPAERNPAQIELLETKYRFETNGDSRKEVHTRVKINSELGVRQFARLNFDFNRSFQSVEIPLVRITHPSGGVADILPSAITDNPNPAVVDFPAYHDIRVKSVRILGLQPGDLLEYRVITTTTHHPLAPDFWLDHTFDRSGVVSQEIFTLDLPDLPPPQIWIKSTAPHATEHFQESARTISRWEWKPANQGSTESADSDIAVTTFSSWKALLGKLDQQLGQEPQLKEDGTRQIALDLTANLSTYQQKVRAVYKFVSQKISTVDLPLGSSGFQARPTNEILSSGYGTTEDKFVVFNKMVRTVSLSARPAFAGITTEISHHLPRPTLLTDLLAVTAVPPGPFAGAGCGDCEETFWLDLTTEVAPFGLVPANLHGHQAIVEGFGLWMPQDNIGAVPRNLPFDSIQKVRTHGRLSAEGTLTATVKYSLRGDNELLLRVAFHKTPKEKWKDVAQLLALSDGFRGDITNVTASDPYETDKPFEVQYEITQPKFVDWSKKAVRIPALLPSPGLPDATPSTKASGSSDEKKIIDLGTPLEIELDATVTLPEDTTALAPTGATVQRDYATFSSNYSAQGNTLHAKRKLHFILQEIPVTRAGDLNAFLHAVQADQAQLFTLQPPAPK